MPVTGDSGAREVGAVRHLGQSSDGAPRDQVAESAPVVGREQQRDDSHDASVTRLLAGYGEVLDAIAAKPAIVFLANRSVSRKWLGRRILIPRANFTAGILAETHVAAHVDALLRRGNRVAAIDPEHQSPIDLDRVETFGKSLRPMSRRALTIWIVVLSLAVAFPVAWITDYLRTIVPEGLVCSSRFSLQALIARVAGTTPPVIKSCRHLGAGVSLVETLVRAVHLNLNPGGVIDTILSVRASGIAVVLLLAVVWILCLSVVLWAFRSGFRLKRLAFSIAQTTVQHGSLLQSATQSEGLYGLEREVFAAVGAGQRREFPLDLAVSTGLLVLPLTIATDLFVTAALPGLDLATMATTVVIAVASVMLVALRLHWLVRVWRSRTGAKVLEARERWLSDGSTVLVRSGAYGAALLGAGYIIWTITLIATPDQGVASEILGILLAVPVLSWPLCMLWWFRLHRELTSYGHSVDIPVFRAPVVSLLPLLSTAALVIIGVWTDFSSGSVEQVATVVLACLGFAGFPVSVYRMGRSVDQLRRLAKHRDWKARAAGFRAAAMGFLLPVPTILFFQHSLNRIWREVATMGPVPSASDALTTESLMPPIG